MRPRPQATIRPSLAVRSARLLASTTTAALQRDHLPPRASLDGPSSLSAILPSVSFFSLSALSCRSSASKLTVAEAGLDDTVARLSICISHQLVVAAGPHQTKRTLACSALSRFFSPSNPPSARSISSLICGSISLAKSRCAARTSDSVTTSKHCVCREVSWRFDRDGPVGDARACFLRW